MPSQLIEIWMTLNIFSMAKLSAALKRGVAAAKRGEPYLIDVITQPR